LIEAFDKPIAPATLRAMLLSMLASLEARGGRIEVSFPFFLRKTAPVSRATSLLDYEVTLIGECQGQGVRVFQRVRVPVTSLCPCSKKISDYGAHNQRSHLIIEAQLREDISIEELIRVAEDEASCELWGLLKRADEKFVTERAYENPKFAEDIVRDVAHRLNQDSRIAAYTVEVENFESIHNHSAFALLDSARCNPD
jgi:GTP cyclohydrolase I